VGENLPPCNILPGSKVRIAPGGHVGSFRSHCDTFFFVAAGPPFRTKRLGK
jgi:hypothetical protein